MLPEAIQMEVEKGTMLPLMEDFYTIQGEGFHTGTAAYFVRLGGCDVGCHWCDVKERWDANLHPPTSVPDIVSKVSGIAKTVVVTGGEPLMWDMTALTSAIRAAGMRAHIETSGAYPVTGEWDWFCLSPKKTKLPVDDAYAKADELKVVIYNRHDLVFAEEQASRVNKKAVLFLQPEWSKKDQVTEMIIEYVKANPKWRISLQTHKFLNIP